jgi:hypothetical protein
LTAASYRPVADLDPRVADALLAELKEQGVAAYTRPVESTSMSGFDRPEFREGALDRLYVDAGASAKVREQLDDKDPDLVSDNDDLTWAQIVAGFDQPISTEVAPWPANEDVDTGEVEEDDAAAERAAWLRSTRLRAERLAGRSGDDEGWDEDDDSTTAAVRAPDQDAGFVPQPPAPLPKLEPYKQLAWIGVIGGPALLLFGALFTIALPDWVAVLAVGGFVGGFLTLVATMDSRDDDQDPGSGAVV